MWKYIVKRLLLLIPVLIGVTLLVFAIMNLRPGNPGQIALGMEASQEAIDAYNAKLGLDQPFFTRYFQYMGNLLKGDFGQSWYGSQLVSDRIFDAFPHTLTICLLSVLLAMLLGIPIGILSAVKQYSIWDRIATIIAMLFASIPKFWQCLLMSMLFAVQLKLLPAYGLDSWQSYIMPVFCLSTNTMGLTIRLTRSSMLEEIRKDYVRTARAKGAKEKSVIFRHALRNSLIPVVTACGVNFSLLLGGTVFTESVYAIPGLGSVIVKSISNKDVPMIMGCVVILAICAVVINLLIDILYAYLDPRIKAKYIGGTKKKKKEVATNV